MGGGGGGRVKQRVSHNDAPTEPKHTPSTKETPDTTAPTIAKLSVDMIGRVALGVAKRGMASGTARSL